MKLRDEVIELLEGGWYSNFQINMELKSSSADRIMRFIRETPPEGYYVEQRKKDWDKYADSKKIPVAELLKNCWWFECKGCGKQITEDDILSGDATIIDEERNDFVQGGVICKECAEREDRNV